MLCTFWLPSLFSCLCPSFQITEKSPPYPIRHSFSIDCLPQFQLLPSLELLQSRVFYVFCSFFYLIYFFKNLFGVYYSRFISLCSHSSWHILSISKNTSFLFPLGWKSLTLYRNRVLKLAPWRQNKHTQGSYKHSRLLKSSPSHLLLCRAVNSPSKKE